MPEWRQLIGQFVRESNASEREADGEAAELTKSAHYSYDQKEDIALNIQPKTYQSYDQAEDNSISTLAEVRQLYKHTCRGKTTLQAHLQR